MNNTFLINYNLNYREYFKAMVFLGARMKIIKRLFLYILVIDGVWALITFIGPPKHGTGWQVVLQVLFLPSFTILFFLFFGLLGSLLIYKLKPQFFKNVTFRFTHWGIEKTGKGLNLAVPWRNVVKWKETKSFLLLYVTANDAHIIPKRLFNNRQELEDFKNLLIGQVGLFQ